MSVDVSDMSPSLSPCNTLTKQMKCSLGIEVISIQIFVVPTIKQEREKVLKEEMMEEAEFSVALTLSTKPSRFCVSVTFSIKGQSQPSSCLVLFRR